MSKLYFDYVKERHGHLNKDVIEIEDKAFAIYQIFTDENGINYITVHDMYVVPEHRAKGLAVQLVKDLEKVAADYDCQFSLSQVDMNSNGWQQSVGLQLKMGAKPTSINKNIIYFIRDLSFPVPLHDYTIHLDLDNSGLVLSAALNSGDKIVKAMGNKLFIKRKE